MKRNELELGVEYYYSLGKWRRGFKIRATQLTAKHNQLGVFAEKEVIRYQDNVIFGEDGEPLKCEEHDEAGFFEDHHNGSWCDGLQKELDENGNVATTKITTWVHMGDCNLRGIVGEYVSTLERLKEEERQASIVAEARQERREKERKEREEFYETTYEPTYKKFFSLLRERDVHLEFWNEYGFKSYCTTKFPIGAMNLFIELLEGQ